MPRSQTIPGVDPEPELSAPLSKYYNTATYRATPERRPSWAQIKNPAPGSWCDECARRQHETRGESGQRAQPRHRRSFAGEKADTALRLCSRHETAWKERDAAVLGDAAAADQARPRGKAARK